MGCKDADYQHDHSEVLKYHITLHSGEITLRGEFQEERTSLDEL